MVKILSKVIKIWSDFNHLARRPSLVQITYVILSESSSTCYVEVHA